MGVRLRVCVCVGHAGVRQKTVGWLLGLGRGVGGGSTPLLLIRCNLNNLLSRLPSHRAPTYTGSLRISPELTPVLITPASTYSQFTLFHPFMVLLLPLPPLWLCVSTFNPLIKRQLPTFHPS